MSISLLREVATPVASPLLVSWFQWYSRRYLRKHFHGLRICGEEHLRRLPSRPIVLCLSHASWWDPIVSAVIAAEFLRDREHFAPIDEDSLDKYPIFRRLGFFGVEQNSRRGGLQFLGVSRALLARDMTALWITVQGKFADIRQRPFVASAGLPHLASQPDARFLIVPVAVEYSFWEERTPEILVRIGPPLDTSQPTALDWKAQIEQSMTGLLDDLCRDSVARRAGKFHNILDGHTGTGGIYDLWRTWTARLHGERFTTAHGRRELQ